MSSMNVMSDGGHNQIKLSTDSVTC